MVDILLDYKITLKIDAKIHDSVMCLGGKEFALELFAARHGFPTKLFEVCDVITPKDCYVIQLNTLSSEKVLVDFKFGLEGSEVILNSLRYLDLMREKIIFSYTF